MKRTSFNTFERIYGKQLAGNSSHRDAWVKLFVKYNTSLPSSAAAERLFSTAGNILRPKRSSLTANNFEQLVMLKGNSEQFKTFLKEDLKKGADTDLE